MSDLEEVYETGASEERARIAWWLRACADGPGVVGADPAYLTALTDIAEVIEKHPERFVQAPPHRPAVIQGLSS